MASNQDPKITVYWLEYSRAQRIVWLLEELKLPYELKMFKRMKDMQADRALKDIHPLGKSPVVTVESADSPKPIVLAESGYIVTYLIDKFGRDETVKLYPRYSGNQDSAGEETESWRREQYFTHYVEGSLMPFLQLDAVLMSIREAPVPFFIKPITRMISNRVHDSYLDHNVKTHLAFLEDQLTTSPGNGQYLCGSKLSGADILIIYALQVEADLGLLNETDHPKLTAYLKDLKERPAYKEADSKVKAMGWSSSPMPRI